MASRWWPSGCLLPCSVNGSRGTFIPGQAEYKEFLDRYHIVSVGDLGTMDAMNGTRTRFGGLDIRAVCARLALLAGAVVAGAASAQLIDSTLDEVVDQQIDRQVEQDLAAALEDELAQQVEADVASSVEAEVAGAVEQQVAATVEQQIEADVVDAVQQQVEAGVGDAIEQSVESGVAGALERTLGVAAELGEAADAATAGVGAAAGGAIDGAREAAGGAAPPAAETPPAAASNERFFASLDALGRGIERDVWVVLVPQQFAARIPGWGFTIRERRELPTLARVLLRVDAPEDRDIAQAALDLALDAPGTLVDFNHVYRPGADAAPGPQGTTAAGKPSGASLGSAAPQLAIGIVDSAVAVEHEALRAADVVQQDFVPFAAERPTRHGTAVASILVGDARALEPRLRGARLYAASVFFEDDGGEPAATTASLVAALEWLAAQRVRVANMSLAGPPNRVLEAAVTTAADGGAVVVAAVGNDGPGAEPLYPAAYASVVGITAVDAANRVYRYANRGRQVTFAAPGVRIKVARSAGGYATETGTSMAAPYAAAVIVHSLAAHALDSPADVLAALKAAAIDLGAEDFDDVYGFGLIVQ
jgi:subtilisin family serine protease